MRVYTYIVGAFWGGEGRDALFQDWHQDGGITPVRFSRWAERLWPGQAGVQLSGTGGAVQLSGPLVVGQGAICHKARPRKWRGRGRHCLLL